MKVQPVFVLLALCAGCAQFPELEGREAPSVKSAPYPTLVPLSTSIVPPVDPVNEASEVEEELTQRAEELSKKADALQNTSND